MKEKSKKSNGMDVDPIGAILVFVGIAASAVVSNAEIAKDNSTLYAIARLSIIVAIILSCIFAIVNCKRRFMYLLLAGLLCLSGLCMKTLVPWEVSDPPETPVPSETDERKPSAADLDAINANITYPRNEYYLSEYITKYVQASGNRRAVYAFINPNNQIGLTEGNYFTVYNGTEVTVIAQSSGYACVIIPSMNRAAWINSIYLIDG